MGLVLVVGLAVVGSIVGSKDLAISSIPVRSIELHVIGTIEPLDKALTVVGGDFRPMHEHINAGTSKIPPKTIESTTLQP